MKTNTNTNFFDWCKEENEKTYTDGMCTHIDRVFMPGLEICCTCKTEWKWNSKTYGTNHSPIKYK